MAEDRTFLMGKFPAVLPGRLHYTRNHMWCDRVDNGWRFGFTTYAIRLMQDVYFLEWMFNPGDAVSLLQQIGFIESSKAQSELYAPMTGNLVDLNQALLADPSGINVDGHGAGWLFIMAGAGDSFLDVDQYYDYLALNWDKTQAMIKGKINSED
jgi:glycine cleavage system H protein